MLNNIKAKLRKLADVTAEDCLNFFRWSDSELDATNPNTIVCSALLDGEPVLYLTAEPVFVLDQYAVHPKTTPSQATEAGYTIDVALVHEMKKTGIGKALIVLPQDAPTQPDEQVLRYIERKLPAQQHEQVLLPDDMKKLDPQTAWVN